jgi:hypothetical protein
VAVQEHQQAHRAALLALDREAALADAEQRKQRAGGGALDAYDAFGG